MSRNRLLAVGIALALAGCTAPDAPNSESAGAATAEHSPAGTTEGAGGEVNVVSSSDSYGAKLAAIDRGTTVVPAETIARYDAALDRLAPLCTEPHDRISDFAVVGVDLLRKEGVRRTTLEFLGEMEGAIPPTLAPMNCAEIAAAIVTLAGH